VDAKRRDETKNEAFGFLIRI